MNSGFNFDPSTHTFSKGDVAVPSVTQVLAWSGICDYSFLEEERSKFYLDRGKSVHWLLQLEDEGALNYRKVPRALLPYRRAYKTWKQRSGFMPTLIERPMISPLGFGGIPDRYGKLDNANAVVEFKTGAVSDWTRYQLAAQCILIQPNLALARTIRRIGLSLLADGTYKVKEFLMSEFDSDIARFIEALRRINGNGD